MKKAGHLWKQSCHIMSYMGSCRVGSHDLFLAPIIFSGMLLAEKLKAKIGTYPPCLGKWLIVFKTLQK